MSLPTVWSERQEAPGVVGLHDCTYSANLMVLVFAGKRSYPLGLYSAAEREALERSDERPDETGATHRDTDLAIRRRYGVTMRMLADQSAGGLRAALSTPGRAYAVAGMYGRLPSILRRHDPGFTGAHDVCVIPLGNGRVQLLDPLAPFGYAGEPVAVDTILAYAFIPNDARWLAAGELEDPMLDPARHTPLLVADCAAGGTLYADPDRRAAHLGGRPWGGGLAIGLATGAVAPKDAAGRTILVPVLVNLANAGEPRRPAWCWYGNDKINNVRLPGGPVTAAPAIAALRDAAADLLTRADELD
jgi:hypothetical protein